MRAWSTAAIGANGVVEALDGPRVSEPADVGAVIRTSRALWAYPRRGVSRPAGAPGVPAYAVPRVLSLTSVEAREAGLAAVCAFSDVEPDRLRCVE